MPAFIFAVISISLLFFSYRVTMLKSFIVSGVLSLGIVIAQRNLFTYDTILLLLYVNMVPVMAEIFKRDSEGCKENIRVKFDAVKAAYEELINKDRREVKSTLEKERKLNQVLSLYEISKGMSAPLLFHDIFDVFAANIKRLFRFRATKCVILQEEKDVDAVYQIEFGSGIIKTAPDAFDKELIDIVFETKKGFSVSFQEGSILERRLLMVKDFTTLIAAPLFIEGKIKGIIYIENISRVYFDSFMILAKQFAIHFQRAMLYKKVEEMSITDSLTGLSTRRYFLQRFDEEIKRSTRHKINLSLLMLDIDYFKGTNDKFGHLVGDVVLKEAAKILKSSLREIDMIGRYGGEEFCIVLSGTGKEEAFHVAERIRKGIEESVFKPYDEVVTATISTGISTYPEEGAAIETLIESADLALYKAKETGRNRVC